jgi:hypothetical protein
MIPLAVAAARAPSTAPAPSLAGLEVALSDLPIELHRRAADYLELERERVGSPWADARLADRVLPMHRPGEATVGYYEVRVLGPDDEARGFFVLAAGRHDYPVPLASSTGRPRSAELEAALPAGGAPARVYFASPVSWVAESARGEALASIGGLPPKVLNADPAWLDLPASERTGHTFYDGATGERVSEAPKHEIELGEWSSWREMSAEYADNYEVLHEALRRGAADDWKMEDDFRATGEGLASGWFREIPLLERGGATVKVSGEGADFVRVDEAERIMEQDSAARIFVQPIDREGVFEVDVEVAYGDGSQEVHRFQVTRQIELPAARPELGALAHAELAAPVAVVATPECNKVAIRSSQWDTYVFARNGGGSTIEARGGWIGSWEVFKLHKKGTNRVALQAPNGKFVYAVGGGGGAVRVDSDNSDGDARLFRKRYPDGQVAFMTRGGNFLRANMDGMIDAGATTASTWERFELEYCEPTRLEGQWAGNDPIDAYSQVRKYSQIPGGVGPNTTPCSSGCGATAWAMVFAWADHMAARGDKRWLGAANLYRKDGKKTGPDADAPEWMWTDVPANLESSRNADELITGPGKITEEIRSYMNDWGASGCSEGGSRFTAPHIMGQATQYLTGRVTTKLTADYDGASIMTDEGKRKAKRRLEDKQVVAIGIGYYSHYPVAFGFEDARYHAWNKDTRRWASESQHQRFVVHMGWGKPGSVNVPYDTWFQGWIDPPAYTTAVTTVNASATAPKPPLVKAKKPIQAKPPSKLPPGFNPKFDK